MPHPFTWRTRYMREPDGGAENSPMYTSLPVFAFPLPSQIPNISSRIFEKKNVSFIGRHDQDPLQNVLQRERNTFIIRTL